MAYLICGCISCTLKSLRNPVSQWTWTLPACLVWTHLVPDEATGLCSKGQSFKRSLLGGNFYLLNWINILQFVNFTIVWCGWINDIQMGICMRTSPPLSIPPTPPPPIFLRHTFTSVVLLWSISIFKQYSRLFIEVGKRYTIQTSGNYTINFQNKQA